MVRVCCVCLLSSALVACGHRVSGDCVCRSLHFVNNVQKYLLTEAFRQSKTGNIESIILKHTQTRLDESFTFMKKFDVIFTTI